MIVVIYQLQIDGYNVSGGFQFQWIFCWECVGVYFGVSVVGVDIVYLQVVVLIFVGQYLYYFFGGEFGNGIGVLVGVVLMIDVG